MSAPQTRFVSRFFIQIEVPGKLSDLLGITVKGKCYHYTHRSMKMRPVSSAALWPTFLMVYKTASVFAWMIFSFFLNFLTWNFDPYALQKVLHRYRKFNFKTVTTQMLRTYLTFGTPSLKGDIRLSQHSEDHKKFSNYSVASQKLWWPSWILS